MITEAVKAAGDFKLEVLGLPFGEDRSGQIFTPSTDIGLQPGDTVPAYFWHGYAERAAKAARRIGAAKYRGADDRGHWFDVELNRDSSVAAAIYRDAQEGKARASSDSASHLVRPSVAAKGEVTSWPIFALSLMDRSTSGTAINPKAVAYAAAKAFVDEATEAGEDQAGEGAGAVKAGAAIAKRNQERVLRIGEAIQTIGAALDELKSEFLTEEATDANGSDAQTDTPAAKGGNMDTEIQTAVDAVKAEMGQKIDALETKLVELQRPGFGKKDGDSDPAAKAYEDGFMAYVRSGDVGSLKVAAKAALNETTAANGGYLVPRKYSPELVQAINEASILRQAGARVIPVSGTKEFKVATLSNTTAAVLTAEAASFDQKEPTVGEVTFTPYKYTRLSLASDEILEDSAIEVFSNLLLPDAANSFAQAENSAFVVGTGSSQPQGVFPGASLGKTAAATNAITADEVIDLFHSLEQQYRGKAVWIMKDSTLASIRKLRENGSTGAYLWQPGLSAGAPSTILGRPVYTVSTAPAVATGNRAIVFGDMSYFWIADFGQTAFKRLEELYAGTGQVGFRWFKRFDSHVMLSAAIKALALA